MTRTPLAKEKDTQRLILDWLNAKGIWNMRLNTGAMGGSHNGKRWFVRFGKPGMADVIAVKAEFNHAPAMASGMVANMPRTITFSGVSVISAGQAYPVPVYWIEVKGSTGKQSPEQKAFQAEVEAQGMKYILARSLDDVTAVLT